jgi:TRAP-type mannitol/chloroaromatic compound transport system permease small subunit
MNALYHILHKTAAMIDRIVDQIGRMIAYLVILLVFVTCYVVLTRYGFNIGSIAVQETVTYMHATIFMLGAAYTLQRGGHVRVDVFYSRINPRQQAWINALGSLFLLLPTAACLVYLSMDFVVQAWQIKEASIEQEGLPFVYLLKTLIPLGGSLLFLQGISIIIHNTLALVGIKTIEPTHSEAVL